MMKCCCCCCFQSLSSVWLFCNPMYCSPPGSSVHRISQSRIPDWVATSFSRGSSEPKDQNHVSCTSRRFFTAESPGKPDLKLGKKERSPSLDKSAKIIQWEKNSIFDKWCWDNWISTCQKMTLDPYLTSYTKSNLKWIKDLNIRAENIELLEEHIGASLRDLDLAKRFLDMTVCAITGKNW